MPTFEYVALRPGQTEQIRGKIDADTERDARSKIRLRGEVPVSIATVKVDGGGLRGLLSLQIGRGYQKDVLVFTTQLATLIRSGITLTDSLRVLFEQCSNPQFSNVLNIVYHDVVERGQSFAEAMRNFPQCFSSLYVSMVRAGESTGTLPDVLDRLATYAKKRAKIEGQIKSAMTYPIVMMVVGSAILVVLMVWLVPKITEILLQQKKSLPLATEILIGISNFMMNYWHFGLIGLLLAMLALRWFVSRPKGRMMFDHLKLSTPVLGELTRKSAVSRFCITLSSLLKSGVKIEEAMRLVEEVVGNTIVRNTVRRISEKIREGASISGPLTESDVFPKMVTFMISVGERAGSDELQQMLDNIAEAYDLEVEQSADRLTALLNPILLLFMAVTVGFILMAVIMPIMSISQM